MGRILADAEIEILKKCKEAREAAVKQAAAEIKNDAQKNIFDQAVSDYYDDYSPTRYRRTESLYNAFQMHATTDGKRINVSGDWDFNRLPQYQSRSKYHQSGSEWVDFFNRSDDDDNGIPEKGWIFSNFMEGIHPRFYFDKHLGVVIDDSMQCQPSYIRIRDYKNAYFQSDAMRNILLKNLKQQLQR